MRLARVCDIITDKNSQEVFYDNYGEEKSIGGIMFNFFEDPSALNGSCNNCHFAFPMDINIGRYPVPGELVFTIIAPHEEYYKNQKEVFYYLLPFSIFQLPTSNAFPDILDENNEFYQGSYFKDKGTVNPLLPYEGDITIEGRFGQSIRFGSTIDNTKVTKPNRWSNEGDLGNPITIIRNGQAFNPNTEGGEKILENVDEDHSSIYLCSSQQLSNFQPASLFDESYGQDIFKEIAKEEVAISDTEMPSSIEEDVELNRASNLPAEELQQLEEPIEDTPYAYYEVGEDVGEDLNPNINADDIVLPSSYIIPDNQNP